MKLEQTFEVAAPLEQVWVALNDLERVAPCLPGASITSHDEDGTYHGTFTVKLGPMTAAYNGTIKIDDVDEAAHRATLKARGTDKRGQGGANATIVNTLSEHDGGTRVEAVTDFSITGRLAQFGRGGIMQDVSNRLLRDFATCLSTRLAEPAEAAPTEAPESSAPAEEVAAAGTTPASSPPPTPPPPATPPPTAPAAQPLKGGSLFFGVLWERIKSLFKRR
jgi:carbon monoxide dehydrogenase subunit G